MFIDERSLIDETLIQKNQDIINFFNADAMFDELYGLLDKYGYDYIFKREFLSYEDLLLNYCIRSRIVKLATDACEHYSKAILIKNGLDWDDMKSIGHNLYKAYDMFNNEDKEIIKNAIFFNENTKFDEFLINGDPVDNTNMDILKGMYAFTIHNNIEKDKMKKMLDLIMANKLNEATYKELEESFESTPRVKVYINDRFKSKKVDSTSFEEILSSLSSERIQPSIKSRYPGQKKVDYDEKFIIAYSFILHELCDKYIYERDYYKLESYIYNR